MKVAAKMTTTVLIAVGALTTIAVSAWASQGYESITGTFGKACEANPCAGGQFNGPTGIAVNYKTGDVYVVDTGDDRVEWFNADGSSFEGQFDGSGQYEVKTTKETGTPAPDGKFLEPGGVAIDNDPASPSYEDVYVADVGHGVIDKFSPTGEYLGDFAGGKCEGEGEVPPCIGSKLIPFSGELNVAVDPAGNVWVYEAAPAEIYEFNHEGTRVKEPYALPGRGQPNQSPGFAVDASGDIYVTAGGVIYEYNQANGGEREIVKERESPLAALAVISSTGRLLVDEGSKIELFGSPLRNFPHEGLAESRGLAVNGANGEGTLYASEHGRNDVAYFDPGTPAAPEIISATAMSKTREEGAFEVVINPNDRNTNYHVEYSTKVSSNGKELEGEIQTLTGSELPAEFTEDKATVTGALFENSNASYYYRVVATNELGEVKTEIRIYTKLPSVLPGETMEVTSTGVTLGDNVAPDFVETAYTFYLADKQQYEHGESVAIHGLAGLLHQKRLKDAELICPGIVEEGGTGTLPEGANMPCPASAEIEGLTPGETYYFRVVATNEVTNDPNNANKGNPVDGEWVAFTPYPPPQAAGGQATAVTSNSAYLSGEVDPGGATGSYYFAYIGSAEYEEALKNGAANPSEPGYQAALEHGAASPYAEGATTAPMALPASKTTQAAGPALAAGLRAGTTYHYALVATNRFGLRMFGPDHTFTTQAAVAPSVSTGAASSVTQTTATLSGSVNTNGLTTSYGFEVSTTPGSFGPATGLGTIASGETKEVSVELRELQPGTIYHYRVVATSSDGTVYGLEQAFATTPALSLLNVPLSVPILDYTAPPSEIKTMIRGPPSFTPAQKLAKALKACRKDKAKSKRVSCENAARKKYKIASKKHRRKK